MKEIRIWFDCVDGASDVDDNFIINILRNNYKVILDKRNPNYLFYSFKSKKFLEYDCVRIFYTAENLVPDFNLCDYAIGFPYLNFGDRYIRYPIYLVSKYTEHKSDNYSRDLELALHKHEHVSSYIEIKNEFCAFTYSNKVGAECREKIFNGLMRYKYVNSGGRFLNNVGGAVADKLEFQRKHKFVIAFENTSTSGYTTEKIVGAYAAGAVPIYWGNPDIDKEFNPESFINCHDYGLTKKGEIDAIDRILTDVISIDSNDNVYEKMLMAPAFTKANNIVRQQEEFEHFLYHIFDQNIEEAFRRNKYYWGERYERKMKIGNDWYNMLRKALPLRDSLRKIARLN